MTDEIKNEKTVSLSPGAAAFRTYKKYCFLSNTFFCLFSAYRSVCTSR